MRPTPSTWPPLPSPPALPSDAILEILESGRFGVQYEPIVELSTGETVAFEALARFHAPDGSHVPPGIVFSQLHAAPALFAETELTVKRLQIERAPGHTLFVNVDPDAFAFAPDGGAELLAVLEGAPCDVVVEAIENLETADAARGRAMVAALRERGLPFGLDDVGASNGLLSFDLLALADYLKLDRSLLRRPRDARRLAVAGALVTMAARTGARVVLEGVESGDDLDLARELGVGLVQGYLFRERFVRVAPER